MTTNINVNQELNMNNNNKMSVELLRSSRDGTQSVSPSCATLTRGYQRLTPSELYSAVHVPAIKGLQKNNGEFQPLIRIINKCILTILLCVVTLSEARSQEASEEIAALSEFALSGTVRASATGEPIAGVRVSITGLSSSITDDDGRFHLRRSEVGDIIIFSGQGFAQKEVVASGKTELNVELHDESFQTVYKQSGTPFGYKDWIRTTAATSSISGGEQYKKAIVSSESMIQDEGLGVNTLMRSGAPGTGANMYLRGFNSINATNQPMILIDGVPYENTTTAPSLVSGNLITPLTGFDTKDIENITILKDASSIFGSKGANGAILIETAKASDQVTRIDFHAYAGVNPEVSNLYPMMNAWEYKSYLSEMLTNSGQYSSAQLQALPYFNQEKPRIEAWGVEGNQDYYRYNKDTDWQKEVFNSSATQNFYLSIKGGDDIALYALSVGVLNRGGVIENTNFNRYNTQFNAQLNITSWLKIKSNMNFSYGARQLSFESQSRNYNPVYVSLIKAPFMAPYIYSVDDVITPNYEPADVFNVSNPSALVDKQSSMRDISYRFFGNISGIADLGKNIELGLTLGVIFDKLRESIFMPGNGLYHDDLPAASVSNEATSLVSRYFQYYADARVGYYREFDRKHSVSAKAGFRYQTNMNKAIWIEAYNSSSDDLKSVGNGQLDLSKTSGIIGDWKWTSVYLNGEYGYRNRYFLSYNMAMDGSSRFGKEADGIKIGGDVFGLFPSITGAWLISSENFMMDMMRNMKIDLLKLRVGYSITGNDDIGNYSARTVYSAQNFLGFYGLVRRDISNLTLKWETNAKINAGLDMALFNERLNLSFDVYQSKTTDLLGWRQSEDYYGVKNYAVNDGTLKNSGFELGVRGRIVNREVKWDLGVNIARYKNELTAMSVDQTITEIAGGNVLTKVGNPIGLFYGYKTDGVYATQADADATGLNIQHGDGRLSQFNAGDVRFVSNDNILKEDDMAVIGDPNPDFFGSIVNRVQWKRFALSFVFTYSYGNDIYNALRASVESQTGAENQTKRIINRWNREGHITSVPRAVWGDPMGNSRFSDRWIEDGSYIRLKTLSLSYDIPVRLSFIKGLQVYVTGNNLLTFTNYMGYDPEFSVLQSPLAMGIDTGMVPQPRTVLFGIKLGL